ncbi:MAG: exo-alpha-sialidase [Planctomycetia bacterium]
MTIARPASAVLFLAAAAGVACAGESFETAAVGPLATLATPIGTWTAAPGHAEIHAGHARDGRQSLKIEGGEDRAVALALPAPLSQPGRVTFWAERWTARPPFAFMIEAAPREGPWRQVHDAGGVQVGGFKTRVDAAGPAGTARLRLRATSHSGVMLDVIDVGEDRPMTIQAVTVTQPVMPVFIRRPTNPVIGIAIETTGGLEPLVLEEVTLSLAGTSRPADVAEVALFAGAASPSAAFSGRFGGAVGPLGMDPFRIAGRLPLTTGTSWLWVSVRPEDRADLAGRFDVAVRRLLVSGRAIDVAAGDPPGGQRLGVAVRLRHEDGPDTYRIPGLLRTRAGTLLAAYDVRHRGPADLPADIDVGISRSTDGGRTWEPMRIALDLGRDPAFAYDGVGDPCIFADRTTGRIFVAALWSHGRRAWHGSGPGIRPDETGQLVLSTSDDDGRTWSHPVNITAAVKDPAWRLLLAGPGTGITLTDGTLVFPAQFKDADNVPHSTLIWSKDHGEHWRIGSGVKGKTTESQLVELGDGSIMINCRDDRGGSRTVAVTDDLGTTWRLHPTDRSALPESVCMASLLRLDLPDRGPRLFFSNPATTSGRHTMTVKVSADDGLTWPDRWHTLYDARAGFGYSCLAEADAAHLGVLYEGTGDLLFLRLPFAELLQGGSSP